MKKILIGLAVIVVIIGGGMIFFLSNLDNIVKTAVEEVGSEVTGVSVTLDKVALELTDGKASLSGFMVGNPDGFETDYAISLGGISVVVDPETVTSDTIVIKSVRVDAPKVIYELGASGSNIDEIQANVERLIGGASAAEEAPSESDGPKIIIEDMVISGGEVAISASFLGGKKLSSPLPEIHLTDIGKDDSGEGASSADVAAEIMGALNEQIIGSVASLNLAGMMEGAGELLGGAAGTVGDVSGEAAEGAKGALKSLFGSD